MEEEVETKLSPEEIANAYEIYDKDIELGLGIKRLLANKDFKLIFEERFIKDWAITQTRNVALYQQASREAVMEQMIARSIFTQFIDELIENGNQAVVAKRELNEAVNSENESKVDEY